MSLFRSNKIISENEAVAEILKNKRLEKKINIEKVAQKTGIHIKYLEALEKGDFSAMPSGVYSKNFLKEYALFLGIDYQELLDMLNDQNYFSDSESKNGFFNRQKTKKRDFLFFPKIIKNILIILIVLGCFAYLGVSLKKIITPPELFVSFPSEDITVHDTSINVVGSTDPEASITINGEVVSNNKNGDFSKNINLKNGMNIIKISAQKKYSQETVLERYVLVEP